MSPRSSSPVSPTSFVVASKLLAGAATLLGISAALAGCPIYSADSCAQDPNCVTPQPVADTGPGPVDCDAGYARSVDGTQCNPSDCRAAEMACGAGQACQQNFGGAYVCVSTVTDCRATGCISGYTCATASSGYLCTSTDANACVADADCPAKTGAGSLCLGGVCKAPKDLCSDSTQCKAGASCVDGRCTPTCAAACAEGYACDSATNLCTGAGAATCSASETKVNGRCVKSAATDGSCPTGTVSVAGGCVVDDRPVFFCDQAGTADGTQDKCSAGSICLHHNCYVSCDPAVATSCAAVDKFNVCKQVTSSAGPKNVCGSSTNLGTECDPTATPPKTCAVGKLCIDGFCK
jgi:hypothetical protein